MYDVVDVSTGQLLVILTSSPPILANKFPAVRKFYADKIKPDVTILSSAEQFEADSEVEAALFDLCEAIADGSSVSAQELSTLVSAGLEADPAVAVSLLSAVVGQDAARMGQLAAPDDLHTYAIIVSKIVQDLTTPEGCFLNKVYYINLK